MKTETDRQNARRGTIRCRAAEEIRIVEQMIQCYCRGKHRSAQKTSRPASKGRPLSLCRECAELLDYAIARIERCPRAAVKTFCSVCPVHCYEPGRRAAIRAVMRYAGPHMALRRPLLVLRHALAGRGEAAVRK